MSDIVLKPAKPYSGKAQWQALRAALKPFCDAGVVTTERLGYAPRLFVEARGWKTVKGYGPSIDVARVWVQVAKHNHPDHDVVAEAKAAFATISAALTAAGWVVEGNQPANVYGPGMDDWIATSKANAQARQENNARLKAEREIVHSGTFMRGANLLEELRQVKP